jgi:SAM-dependent methyltransferase
VSDTERFSVLDATAGGKHIWHEEMKDADRVVFADRRTVDGLEHQPGWECAPDVLCDFRRLPFAAETFDLVCFDPPHRVNGDGMETLSGVIPQKYGELRAETWQSDLRDAFDELWRVLRPGGTLTLKWADSHKSHDDVLAQVSETPLFGVTTEKERAVVKWWAFHKPGAQPDLPRASSIAADGGTGCYSDTGTNRGESE